ncbi:MAG: cobalamin biosynthesis protein [Chloroflexota bacterium]
MTSHILLIFLLALVIDLILGEPPNFIHPVVWMGKMVSFLVKGGIRHSPAIQFLYGLAAVLITIAVFVIPTCFLLFYLKKLSSVAYVIVAATLLKTTFSLRGLRRAAVVIRNLLRADKLDEARFALRAMVSRDTSKLDKSQVVSATVESVAENSCDSFVAPLLYFLLLGVPGAVAYRVINTLDAMIGYHGEFEYLGKFAAHLDSAANLIPSRVTALLIVLAARIRHGDASGAWRVMLRDRGKTESPNAGWTMSAVAGALGVQLEKTGYYRLGDNQNSLLPGTIDASLKIINTLALIWSLLIILSEVIYHAAT